MIKYGLKLLLSFIFLFSVSFAPAHAALLKTNAVKDFNDNINTLAAQTEYDTTVTLEARISTIIRIALSVLGMIFLLLAFLAGNNWMQAAGNEEKVKKAQTSIRNLVIGIIFVLVAYALSSAFSGILVKTLLK